MKKLLMIAALLAVLGGGGGGAYLYFQQPAQASTGPAGAPEKTATAKPDKLAVEPKYIKVDPLILPVIGDKGVMSSVSIAVSLEIDDQKKAEEIKKNLPRLTDAYIRDMYGILNKNDALRDGVVQIDVIKDRLNQITTRVLGDGVVQDVLLQVVSQRPL